MDTNGNYIQNQFCSYEIALKLKELGFGMDDYLQLPFYYDKEGNLHLMEVCVSKKYNPSFSHLGANSVDDFDAKLSWVDNSLDEIYLAPLYQQVWSFLDDNGVIIGIIFVDNVFKYTLNIENYASNEFKDRMSVIKSATEYATNYLWNKKFNK